MDNFWKDVIAFARHLVEYRYFLPIVYVVGGFIIGFVFEKLLISKINKLVQKSKYKFDDFIIKAFRRMVILWLTLAGVYYAVEDLNLRRKYTGPIDKVLLILVILSVTVVLARISVGFIRVTLKKIKYPSTTIFANITYVLIIIVGSLVCLAALDISITPILTALGVGGLAAALALQDTLSNLFAGIQIIATKKINPGDYVRMEPGVEGIITDISWRNTLVTTLANNVVIVPNSKLAQTVITNLSEPSTDMWISIPVKASYTSDLSKIERVTLDVAAGVMREVPGGVPDDEPSLRFVRLGDYSIDFTVALSIRKYTDQYLITHEFIRRIYDRYRAEGINIPFPTGTLFVPDADRKE